MTVEAPEGSLVETREKMNRLRKELHDIFEQAGPEMDMGKVTVIQGDNSYKAGEIRRRNLEMSDLGTVLDRLELLEQIKYNNNAELNRMNKPGAGNGMVFPGDGGSKQQFDPRDLRTFLKSHAQYQLFREGKVNSVGIDLPVDNIKTLVTLSTVNAQAIRRPPVEMALEERTVADLMLQGSTDGNTIEYYEETTFTNAAATVAEGVAKPEGAVGFTLRTEPIRKIAHWIPATKEALDDVPFLESQLRGRMAFGVVRIEEAQLLTGNGAGTNLVGLVNRGVQTQAKGADPTPDAVYKGMQKVRGAAGLGFAEPTATVFHPNDWTDIRLLRTNDGIYIWGNPSDEGPDRIWGLPVRQTTAMSEGTALVGAFRPHAEVIRREGLTIILSTEHSTFAVENKVAIIAEERLGLAVYRPSAFATITGI